MLESQTTRRCSAGLAGATKRFVVAAGIFCAALPLASCGGFVADHWPHFAGGMPNDVPPRPGSPGYDEFIAHKKTADEAAAEGAARKTGATAPAPGGTAPGNDQAVTRGGLY